MEIEKKLVLNNYFLSLFGFESFEQIKANLENKKEGFDSDGRSNFLDGIINLASSKINELDMIRYDRSIKIYVQRLRKSRDNPSFNLKYFQYLAVLFSELFLENFFHHKDDFIDDLNDFLKEFNKRGDFNIDYFSEEDLNKIALSMATGSGKTLIMHINYWQFLKYSTQKWDNIILITPNEGLSEQHHKEMNKSGIKSKVYNGDIKDIKTNPGEVLIIDIHKLTEEKTGSGVRVETSYFEGKNLVFVDEGHKGRKSEEEVWKKRREDIARDGFIFEYSATFRQVIGKNKDLINEYAKSIIFDYSYKHFHEDGFGKDFYIYNLMENRFSKKQRELLLSANLLSFYEQVLIYEENPKKVRKFNIEQPLLIFVGGTVTGKIIKSDIPRIIFYIKKVLEDKNSFKENIKQILTEDTKLLDKYGNDIFKGKFRYLKDNEYEIENILNDIYEKIFKGIGNLEIYEIKNAKGELGLKTSGGNEEYFGVINIGNVSGLKKILNKKNIEVKEDNFSNSLFFNIGKNLSPINILVGSRKFMEGWDSWRVSGMGLLNMGRGKGPQIVQLFGRGIRLKGKNFSLKRSEGTSYSLEKLQTLFIFGLDADYIERFLKAIKREGVDHEEREISIKFNRKVEWNDKLYTIKRDDKFNFINSIIKLEIDENILNKDKFKINLTPRITMTHGLDTQKIINSDDRCQELTSYTNFMDWDDIYLEIIRYKLSKGYYNLLINRGIIKKIIESEKYFLLATEDQVKVNRFKDIDSIREIITTILKKYIDKYYRLREKQESMNYLKITHINEKDDNVSFSKVKIKIPTKLVNDFEGIFEKEEFYEKDVEEIPTIHFDKHLYTPLAIYKKGKGHIKTSPIKLNEGETQFVKDLRNHLKRNEDEFRDKKIFLLRNLSRKGVGFFQKTGGFYPDFILWVKENGVQRILFIDPKGIRNLGNFNDDKIIFCNNDIFEIEKALKKQIKKGKFEDGLTLSAFIISVSDYDSIKNKFDGGRKPKMEEFEKNHILFQRGNYIEKLLET